MALELLEIQPRELKFTFELKRQSSCSVRLINISNHYVAFKVKTTSPTRYCARPNVGIVLPKTTCEFTVTMQAQKVAPTECKDKFLVQSTVVPFGTMEEDLNPSLFSKQNGRFIEESKLRVVLVRPPHSPVFQPNNGASNQEPASEFIVLKETALLKESPSLRKVPVSKESPLSKETCKPRGQEAYPPRDVPSAVENLHPSPVPECKDGENLSVKLNQLESKLSEAENSIMRLLDEKGSTIQERDKLQQEVVLLRRKCAAGVRVGFPFQFVFFIALLGMTLGYLIRP